MDSQIGQPQRADDFLTQLGVTIEAKSAFSNPSIPGHEMDHWTMLFSRPGHPGMTTAFSTGIGHRQIPFVGPVRNTRWGPRRRRIMVPIGLKYAAKKYGYKYPFKDGGLTYNEAEYAKLCKSPLPTAADVMYCLISDASVEGQTFSEWASDLGYSDDSISAKSMYDLCVQQTIHLHRLLGNEFPCAIEAFEDF